MRTILYVLLLVSIYSLVGLGPAIVTMCVNYLIDPSVIWVCAAEEWLSDSGVPYASHTLMASYAFVVWYPALKFARHVCDPLLSVSEAYE